MTKKDIEYIFSAICDFSIHSVSQQIANGFVTVRGGHRVGICGTAVINHSKIETLKNISGINFRIATQQIGCSENICNKIFASFPYSLIISGSTASGKTTMLKDICRILGERFKICVIDERGEIGAVYNGVPQNNIGSMTDVLDGYPKHLGIEMAIRVLNPDIIVCDEIGGENDVQTLINALNTGVKLIATAHAKSIEELLQRETLKPIFQRNAFEYIVHIEKGNIKEVKCAEVYRRNFTCDSLVIGRNI